MNLDVLLSEKGKEVLRESIEAVRPKGGFAQDLKPEGLQIQYANDLGVVVTITLGLWQED